MRTEAATRRRTVSSDCAARHAVAPTPVAGATARSTPLELDVRARGRPAAARDHHQLLHRHAGAVPGTDRDRAVRPGPSSSSTAPTSSLAYQRSSTFRPTRCGSACGWRAVWASGGGDGRSAGMGGTWGPDRLDPDRRARRRRPRPRRTGSSDGGATPRDPTTSPSSAGHRRRWSATPSKSETQLLLEVITDACADAGLTRADIDFTCLGSCDYITGQAFSFVSNLDAIGAWPPKRDSHVEMDGAWALYEAWLRLQEGDIEIAVVTGFGPLLDRRSGADLPDGDGPVLPGAARCRPARPSPRCRPGRVIAAGIADERSMAEVAVRRGGRQAVRTRRSGRRRCRRPPGRGLLRQPLRRHDVPPITDGAAAMVLATGDRARQLVERPAYITGFDHRTECHNPAFRALDDSPSTRLRGRSGRARTMPRSRWPRLQAAFTHEELLLRSRCSASATTWRSTPRAAPLAANPIMATGLCRIGYAADHQGRPAATGPWPTRPRARACNRTSSASWRAT